MLTTFSQLSLVGQLNLSLLCLFCGLTYAPYNYFITWEGLVNIFILLVKLLRQDFYVIVSKQENNSKENNHQRENSSEITRDNFLCRNCQVLESTIDKVKTYQSVFVNSE